MADLTELAAESSTFATSAKGLTKYPMRGDITVTTRGATPITNPEMYAATLYWCCA